LYTQRGRVAHQFTLRNRSTPTYSDQPRAETAAERPAGRAGRAGPPAAQNHSTTAAAAAAATAEAVYDDDTTSIFRQRTSKWFRRGLLRAQRHAGGRGAE